MLKGIAAAALAQVGVRSAWAAATCVCQATGQLYDPVTACCTSGGVQNKNPITSLAACPGKVPHPGYTAVPNGCGPAGGVVTPFIPNSWGAANFLPCCNAHDVCYGTCNGSKAGCDNTFHTCLIGACDAAYAAHPILQRLLPNCYNAAHTYFGAVSLGGGGAFDSAQMEACDCCGTSTCPSACASPGVCGGFSSCGGGGDCVCATLTEGGGTCGHGSTPCAGIQRCTSTSQCPSGYSCWQTSCCGGFGVCVPVCNPIGPAPQSINTIGNGPTVAGF